MRVIIEHLEKLSPWVLLEYRHASGILGRKNLTFTNVRSASELGKLKKLGSVEKRSVTKLKLGNLIVLDPAAGKPLTSKDFANDPQIVIGGICGDYPPRLRTRELISKKIKCEKRNLGKKQMSIDNAVFVAKLISEGKRLEEIKFADELEIVLNRYETVTLHFAYPLVKGKPLVTPGLASFLKKKKSF